MRTLTLFTVVNTAFCAILSMSSADLALHEELANVVFMQTDTTRSEHRYSYENVPVSYNEPDNVTCTVCQWSVRNGSWSYLMKEDSTGSPVESPPLGIRSAPQLGGVSAGSIELRADGSFREWTIMNAGPAGNGKLGIVDDAFMAVKVSEEQAARVVRTHLPASLGDSSAQGVESIEFAGSYPVTRLSLDKDEFSGAELDIFAYSTFRPTDLNASSAPALALTLVASNPTAESINVSFLLSLPFAALNDCQRIGLENETVVDSEAKTYAQCFHACHDSSPDNRCESWFFDSEGKCNLINAVPLVSHAATPPTRCGVRGAGWSSGEDNASISLEQDRVVGPSSGSVTLRGQGDSVVFRTADDPKILFEEFSKGAKAWGSTISSPQIAAHAAASISATVAAGETTSLSIVLAWSFPDRDFSGTILGNKYSEVWGSSESAARSVASRLPEIVHDINKFHKTIAAKESPFPEWLKDMLLNQFSHAHMMMWYRDGRIRFYEAYSCDDVDSVHNDYQRHLLYLWLFPETIAQKLGAWGSWAMASDGHVDESLAYVNGRPMDTPGGRLMGDTTSIFVLELYEWYRNWGVSELDFVKSLWQSVVKATKWMVNNAQSQGLDLPTRCQTTYDHFGFDRQDSVVYNAFIYLVALRAAESLAKAVGDDSTRRLAAQALQKAMISLDKTFWVESEGFFRATTNVNKSNQIFTDSCYGAMLEHHNFGTIMYDNEKIAKHLSYEWAKNQDLYGMRVISNPVDEDTVWMNGPPTYSYLTIVSKNSSIDEALEPLKRMSENFRVRLKDPWNLRALTHTSTVTEEYLQGLPREQGHYGFMLTDLYLYPLLSGVMVDRAAEQLKIDPLFKPPFKALPVLIAGFIGSISAEETGTASTFSYTLSCAFGRLDLPAGGLNICGQAVADTVNIRENESFRWEGKRC